MDADTRDGYTVRDELTAESFDQIHVGVSATSGAEHVVGVQYRQRSAELHRDLVGDLVARGGDARPDPRGDSCSGDPVLVAQMLQGRPNDAPGHAAPARMSDGEDALQRIHEQEAGAVGPEHAEEDAGALRAQSVASARVFPGAIDASDAGPVHLVRHGEPGVPQRGGNQVTVARHAPLVIPRPASQVQ